MRRSYFQTSCPEIHFYVFVANDRNGSVRNRNNRMFSVQMLVTLVIRVNTDRRVAQNCFRTGRCNRQPLVICSCHFVANMEQFRIYFFMNYFFIGKRRACFRIPVDHADTTVNLSFFVQIHEYVNYGIGILRIHCKCRSFPITGSS
ncbi:hypothetical protein D3C86_1778350 [compost metagenome]